MDIKRRIIKFLKEGFTQKEIAEKFQELNIKPNSLIIIEKYLKEIRSPTELRLCSIWPVL